MITSTIFAQITQGTAQASDYDAPSHFAGWIACLFFFVALLGAFKYLFAKPEKGIKQPVRVKEEHDYVTVAKHEADLAAIRADIKQMNTDAVEGRRRLHRDIDAVPQKVLQLLRDTKGLL